MKMMGAFILAALTLSAPIAQAQIRASGVSLQAPATEPPYVLPGETSPLDYQDPPAIATIGDLPVRVWAPVPPPYDTAADRNNAANPLGTP